MEIAVLLQMVYRALSQLPLATELTRRKIFTCPSSFEASPAAVVLLSREDLRTCLQVCVLTEGTEMTDFSCNLECKLYNIEWRNSETGSWSSPTATSHTKSGLWDMWIQCRPLQNPRNMFLDRASTMVLWRWSQLKDLSTCNWYVANFNFVVGTR